MQENTKQPFKQQASNKRIQNKLLSGGITILGVKFDAATLRVILRGMKIYKEMGIETMINPADKQNVPLAVKLVDAFSKELDMENLSPALLNMLPSLRILAVICNGILSIQDTLGLLSTMVLTLLFLFVNDDIKIPTVIYHDIQATVQKVYCPDSPLHLSSR